MQTLSKPFANFAHSFQTLYKLLSNALQTPFKRFQTLNKLLPNPFKRSTNPLKAFQTFSKPFAKALQTLFEGV